MKKTLLLSALMMAAAVSATAQERVSGTFKSCTMNVDGMPKSIELFGQTIELNPDATGATGARLIGQKFLENGYDIIGVNEDFDYEKYILGEMGGQYSTGKHRTGISEALDNPFTVAQAVVNYTQGKPLLDTDGLNLFWKKNNVKVSGESWTAYSTFYGYMDDANDGLIKKGFRHYIATVADGVEVDVYITHMDAAMSEGAKAAREVQIGEVVKAIKNDPSNRPKIFMGDTNCLYTFDRLQELFIDELNATGRFEVKDPWVEQVWNGTFPTVGEREWTHFRDDRQKNEQLDKALYINCKDSKYRILHSKYLCDYSYVDEEGKALADHWPVSVEWTWYPSEDAVYHEHDLNGNGRLDLEDLQLMVGALKNGGKGYSRWLLDVNRDGRFTIQDISLIVDALKRIKV